MEVDFSKEVQNLSISEDEHFMIKAAEDHYVFSSNFLSETWLEWHCFARPIKFSSIKQINKAHTRLYTSPEFVVMRDEILNIVCKSENKRSFIIFFKNATKFTAFKKVYDGPNVSKRIYTSYEEMQKDVKESAGIELPDKENIVASCF